MKQTFITRWEAPNMRDIANFMEAHRKGVITILEFYNHFFLTFMFNLVVNALATSIHF